LRPIVPIGAMFAPVTIGVTTGCDTAPPAWSRRVNAPYWPERSVFTKIWYMPV
jgi:hypothetical protein